MSTGNLRRLQTLRQRMESTFPLRDLPIHLPGDQTFQIAMPANGDDPLDRFGAALSASDSTRQDTENNSSAARDAQGAVAAGIHMPYWGLLWPSGQALAASILSQPERFRGLRALELGAGLGLTSAAAARAGADIIAADCFTESLLFTRYNVLRNAGSEPGTLLLDWRSVAGRTACRDAGPFDVLLAADVLYEQENLTPLLDLVPQVLVPNGDFWLAEPGRKVSVAFVAAASARGWRDSVTYDERRWPADGDTVRVAIHHFKLPEVAC